MLDLLIFLFAVYIAYSIIIASGFAMGAILLGIILVVSAFQLFLN